MHFYATDVALESLILLLLQLTYATDFYFVFVDVYMYICGGQIRI